MSKNGKEKRGPGRPSNGKSSDLKISFIAQKDLKKYLEEKEKEMYLAGKKYNKTWLYHEIFKTLPDWEELTK